MIDINLIRENKELVKENIKKKFEDNKLELVDKVFAEDILYRECKANADNLRSEKNKLSENIGLLIREGKKEDALIIKDKIKAIDFEINELEKKEISLEKSIRDKMMIIPNIIDDSVPIGKDDSENVELEKFGEPIVPNFDIPYHIDIMENFGKKYGEKSQ